MGKSHKKKECAATTTLLPSFWTGLLEENKDENPLQRHSSFDRSLWHEWLEKLYPATLTGLLNHEADTKMPKAAVSVWKAFKSLAPQEQLRSMNLCFI